MSNELQDEFVKHHLRQSAEVLSEFATIAEYREMMISIAEVIANTFLSGQKVMIAGNGGSAGDAQHIACELVTRLFFERGPLPAIALSSDSSVITAAGNDYGFEQIFTRQVAAFGSPGDVLWCLSTSGNSPNIVRACEKAKETGITTIGFVGSEACSMNNTCDHILHVPTRKTTLVQQLHSVAAHIVCGIVEMRIFGSTDKNMAKTQMTGAPVAKRS